MDCPGIPQLPNSPKFNTKWHLKVLRDVQRVFKIPDILLEVQPENNHREEK